MDLEANEDFISDLTTAPLDCHFSLGLGLAIGLGLGLNQGLSEGAIFSDIFIHFLECISQQIKILVIILRLRLSIAIFPWVQDQLGLGLGLNQGFSEGAIFSYIFLHFLECISKQIKILVIILRLRLSIAIFPWVQGQLGLGLNQCFSEGAIFSDIFIHFLECISKQIKILVIILRLRLSIDIFPWGQGQLGLGLGLNQCFSEGAIFSDIFLHFLEWIFEAD